MAEPADPIHPICFCYYNGFLLGLQALLQTQIKYLKHIVFSSSSAFSLLSASTKKKEQEHLCTSARCVSGKPLAQHHNGYGLLVPWLSFDTVISGCRIASSSLFYWYLVWLRLVCHHETPNKSLVIHTSKHPRGAHTHTHCLVSSWNTDLGLLCVLLLNAVTSVTVNKIKCSREEQNHAWYDLLWCLALCAGQLLSLLKHCGGGDSLSSLSDPQSPPNPPIPPYWQLLVWVSLCV